MTTMIKGIIQKIIMTTFGKFVKGIQRDKLSVDLFAGNFKLENISLNHQFFNDLNTPFNLAYSSIGKLNLQAPLSKLSSVSVQCVLDNIYAIFQFKDGQNETMETIRAKKDKILKQVGQVLENTLKKINQEKKEDGMMTKLGKKIIDNLTLKIMNLHLRFEQAGKSGSYAWGITLQEISFTTTDDKWKPTFVERTNDKNEKLFKMMNVKKLNIYWQSGLRGQSILKSKDITDQQRKSKLAAMITQDREVVLSITSQFKLVINPVEDKQSPLYELEIKLEPIKFQIQRLQLQEMMDFTKKNVMQNEIIVKTISKKSKIKLTQQQKEKMKQEYQNFITQILECQQKKEHPSNILTYDASLQQIFSKVQENELKIWALGPIKRKVKVLKQIEIKKKKSGWWSKGSNQLTQQEEEQLHKFIETSFEQQRSSRAASCIFFKIKAELKGGRMLLVDHKGQDIEQQIQFNIGKISSEISKSEDQSYFQSSLEIASINLNLYIPIHKQNKVKKRKMEIFTSERPTDYLQQSDEDSMESFESAQEQERPTFLKVNYKNQLLEEKTVLKKSVNGCIQRLTVIYKKIYMEKFRKFFSFKKGNTFIKGANIENIDSMKEQSLQQSQIDFKLEKILDVNLNVNSPVFICPLNQRQCWCLNLGNLSIKSKRTEQFQQFPMTITSAFLRYYPYLKQCFDINRKENKRGNFSLINDMDFSVNYQRFKKIRQEVLSIELPCFKVNFTQKQYENLMSLTKIFKTDQSQKRGMVELLKQERKQVEDKKTFQSSILKKHETLMSWRQFHGILSGQFLYLYNDKKQLKQNSKISIKNAKIIIKESDQEDHNDNLQIQITNQNQICYLGCHTMPEILKWKLELDKKNQQFKTIHQLIQDYEEGQTRSNKKRSGSQILSSEEENKRKILKFKVSQVEFKYQNDQQDTLLHFQIQNIEFSRENLNQWSEKEFRMKKLIITDRIFKFKNLAYQTLIQAKGVKFQELKGKKKNKDIRKTIISMNIEDIYINWKPDVLLILMRLMNQHFKEQEKHRFDDDIQQSREDHFKQVYQDSKYMFLKENYNKKGKGIKVKQKRDQFSLKSNCMKQTMKMNVTFEKLEINMVHRESHLAMLKIISNQIDCEFSVCQTAKFVKGSIYTLDLYDMTGYPQKQYSTNLQHLPYRILTKQKGYQKPLIQYRWSSYESNSFPNQQKIDSFIWVQIAPLEYEYYQQVTFRMIDYILIQVILLLTQPQMITVNQNLMEQLKKSDKIEQKPIKILFSKYEQIIKKLIQPFFMDMYFKLNNPTLIFKAEKSSHIYYKMKVKQLIFFNQTKKNSGRFDKETSEIVKDLIYEEQYIVYGKDCHFIEVSEKKQKQQQLFQPFKISLELNKLLLQDQINILFPQISNYDRSFLTINKISNIIISHYSRLQYLNINKLVNFNFTFDDQNDQCFIHNFKVTKLLSPKPILYDVVIPQIHMTADYNARENTEQIWKLFKATINNFRMTFRRTKQLDSNMTFFIGLTQFKGYEYEDKSDLPIEHYLMTLCGDDLQKDSTEIIMQNKNSGQKLIQMNVNNLKVNVRTGLLQLIFQYTLIQDWVFPTVNKFVPELIFYATVHKMIAQLCQDPRLIAQDLRQKHGSEKVIKSILSEKFDFANFKLEGLLCYKFQRKKQLTIQSYEQKLRNGELHFTDFENMDPVASMNVILNTEIYRSWVRSPSKRKIIEKFTFTMQDKRHLRVADINNCTIKSIAKRNMNIDRGFLKISFKDVILMQKILNQIIAERKYINYLNEKTGKAQVIDLNKNKQTELSSLENLDLKIQTISFYLINSRRDIFIPILKVNMSCINFTKANTFKKDIMKTDFSASIYYFNNTIFRWEPILEKVNLAFHKLTYYQENNSVFGSFDSLESIMINLSREVFISLKQTLDSWKKQSEQQEKKYIFEQKQIQPLQFVSHYIIRNQTGYSIEIFNQKSQLIKKLGHCQQIDYELEIQNYNEEEQYEIFIGFKIIHPKHNFMTIKNISFNSEKEYQLHPKVYGGPNNILNLHSIIIIKPQVKDSKKVLMIKSSKYVYNYFDGMCQIKALPFDHDQYYVLPKQIHNSLKVSLYDEKVTDYYRYVGKNGVLKIMKKYLVYNYSPIPLQICGKIVKTNDYMGISEKLRIQDVNYKDSLLKIIKNEKQKQYYIFSECYIVDYYGLAFQFEKQSNKILKMYSHKYFLEENPYHVYSLPETEFKFKAKLSNNSTSASLRTTIGKSNFILESKKQQCPFTIYSYLTPLENTHLNQFIRVVEITPQYMLSNATKSVIKICQAESCDSVTLNPYERIPFLWENKQKPKYIRISSYDGTDFWGYSGNLTIQKSTETIVLRKSSDPTMYRIFSIQIQITNTVTFIHVIQPTPKYMLSNNIPGTILQVYQNAIMDEKNDMEHSFPKDFIFNIKYKEQIPFGYQLPLQSHKLQVIVQLDQDKEQFTDLKCDYTKFDDVENNLETKTIFLRNKKNIVVGEFYISLCFENNIKKIKLSTEIIEEQSENAYQFIVKIPQIGISFIGFHQEIRKEIIHIMLNAIEVQFTGNSDNRDMNLVILSCRIQNQLKYNAIFPVIFQSCHSKTAKYFINFKIYRSAKNSRLIHYIGCSINKSLLAITSEELQAMQENISKIQLNQKNEKELEIRKCEMFNDSLPDPEESIYFVEAVIHPLKSNITFKHVNQWGGKLLKTFSSINECPVSAEGQKFKHFSCQSFKVFFDLLLKHYQDGLSKMILPMIGNLTILGSPITFVQKIGSGFKDLVELPSEGFDISPLEGGKGVAKGAASLLSNTISGAFNTVQSITGSLGNGITLLVDHDHQFARQRQNIKNDRSEHVFGGLANGAKSIANGFKNGFTGLFSQPVKGAEKNGLPGFLFGTAKGIGGLVLKPISGVIDAASKTAEGIKNTPEYFSSEKQKRFIRQHNPRPFYNYYKQFRNYDKQLADIIKILQQQDKEKFINLSWCGYYVLISEKLSSRPILILSYEFLFIYDLKKQKLIQTIKCQNLLGVTLQEQGQGSIKLKVFDNKTNREGFISIIPDGGCRKLANQVNTIIRHFSPNFKFG